MHIYIDRITGAWGDASDLVFIDSEVEGMMMQGGSEGDTETVVSFLDNCSDSEIVKYAESMVDTKQPGFVGTYKEN